MPKIGPQLLWRLLKGAIYLFVQKIDSERMGTHKKMVWEPDVEQAFQEAQSMYPQWKRTKISSEKGKTYGMFDRIKRFVCCT